MDVHKLFKPFLFIGLGIMLAKFIAVYNGIQIPVLFNFAEIPFMLAYSIIALIEIYNSFRISITEKIMWTLGFLTINPLFALIYLFFARQRILRKYKLLYMESSSFKTHQKKELDAKV